MILPDAVALLIGRHTVQEAPSGDALLTQAEVQTLNVAITTMCQMLVEAETQKTTKT